MNRILVAGAGPVGLTAALALARRGFGVTVLEAGETLAAESRASTFHPPTLEMLDDLEVAGELLDRGLVSRTFAYRDRRAGLVARLDLSVLAGDTRFPYRLQCEQSKLTPILMNHLLRHQRCDVLFGWPVASAAQTPGRVAAIAADGRALEADWLIGADGAHSAVRRATGVSFEGMTYPERFLVASVDEELTEWMDGLSLVNYVYDPVEWCVLLRTPDHWRVLLPTPADTPDEAEVARLGGRLLGVHDPGRPWRVAHTSMYRVHQRVASAFRSGRVLLAGDAAHVNNPLGGLGMNSGIHDAVAYAAALARGSDDAITAAASQRRKVALEYVQSVSHQNYERLRTSDPLVRATHLAGLRATAADPVKARAALLRSSMIASVREAA
ncbi:FAD-dependent oxidoreductase [Paractinoplanes atraurantiacus]|uniref:3-(3-hydroxy-phenyl)propionate hydroxylase n=1 Tax=Paractinoplanes atraurantiacus TaxID=1036182 RepID=A0A285K2I6_9ACTN|nr:NAD(P)/FAD-dependent oxidoreductase [Actinoplanes atraurantiacus]SNY66799.1 3-(3-hydroxy-phenyl)propionate hydroxylase [Actinoplanes atraurantiacus]